MVLLFSDKAKVNLRLDDAQSEASGLSASQLRQSPLRLILQQRSNASTIDLPVVLISHERERSLADLHSEIVLFKGCMLRVTIELKNESKTILRVHIDLLESYAAVDDLFAMPPDGAYPPRAVTDSSAVTAGNIVSKVTPSIRASAKQQGIQGIGAFACRHHSRRKDSG